MEKLITILLICILFISILIHWGVFSGVSISEQEEVNKKSKFYKEKTYPAFKNVNIILLDENDNIFCWRYTGGKGHIFTVVSIYHAKQSLLCSVTLNDHYITRTGLLIPKWIKDFKEGKIEYAIFTRDFKKLKFYSYKEWIKVNKFF